MNNLDPMVSQIFDDIKESGTYIKPKIDYYIFRNRWLSLFSSATAGDIAPLGDWIQEVCRGNAFSEVEVWKDGTIVPDGLFEGHTTINGGTLMFTVPAMLNNDVVVSLENGKSIASAMIHARELGSRVAVAGTNYINNNVVAGLNVEVNNEGLLSKQMDDIFAHFGIKRENATQISTETTVNTVDNPELRTSNDDLDFEF